MTSVTFMITLDSPGPLMEAAAPARPTSAEDQGADSLCLSTVFYD